MINDYCTHIVKPTETIEDISKLYNVDIDDIVKWNGLLTNKLFIGQNLKIY